MAKQQRTPNAPRFRPVGIFDDPAGGGALRFTFVRVSDVRGAGAVDAGRPSEALPDYVVSVEGHDSETKFHWIKPPTDEAARLEMEAIARERVALRHQWLDKLADLVQKVEGWAQQLDWTTKVVDKPIEDREVGDYTAPGLLLQRETVRLFLEPIARTAPGTEGVVDLCLMPSYDDIAGFYYYNRRWNVHYAFEGPTGATNRLECEAMPLSKATLSKLLGEMKAHAG